MSELQAKFQAEAADFKALQKELQKVCAVPINGFVSTFSSCTSGYRRITETAITMQ
jgi:hypothetical protein